MAVLVAVVEPIWVKAQRKPAGALWGVKDLLGATHLRQQALVVVVVLLPLGLTVRQILVARVALVALI